MLTIDHFLLSLYFTGMLGIAGASKLTNLRNFRHTLVSHRFIPVNLVPLIVVVIPALEIIISLLLVVRIFSPVVELMNAILFSIFLGYKLLYHSRVAKDDAHRSSCGCFATAQDLAPDELAADITVSSIFVLLSGLLLVVSVTNSVDDGPWQAIGMCIWGIVAVTIAWRQRDPATPGYAARS